MRTGWENIYVVGQNEIQVKMILTWFDSQLSLSSDSIIRVKRQRNFMLTWISF